MQRSIFVGRLLPLEYDQNMYERGFYAKGRERREAILQMTLTVFSTNGYRGATLRAIARELDVSPTLLQHYFGNRENLLLEVVQAWDAENNRRGEGLTRLGDWLKAIKHNMEIPGLVRVYTALAVEATDPVHPARIFFRERYQNLTNAVIDDIENQKAQGLCPDELNSERVTRLLIAACEGLQIRWLHSPDFDMYEEFVALLKAFQLSIPLMEISGHPAAKAAKAATAAKAKIAEPEVDAIRSTGLKVTSKKAL